MTTVPVYANPNNIRTSNHPGHTHVFCGNCCVETGVRNRPESSVRGGWRWTRDRGPVADCCRCGMKCHIAWWVDGPARTVLSKLPNKHINCGHRLADDGVYAMRYDTVLIRGT